MRTDKAERRIINAERHLEWVPVSLMRLSETAQRKHDGPSSRAKIAKIASHFDPDLFGYPITNKRDGLYWVVDGGHRYLALLELGYGDQQVQCWVYNGMAESDEADKFLRHNDVKAVASLDKFKVAVVAGWPVETDIDRIVRAQGLLVGSTRHNGVGCVDALRRVYDKAGPGGLATTLRIILDSYGETGLSSKVIAGIGLFVSKYEAKFKEPHLVKSLSSARGGLTGLLGIAETFKVKHLTSSINEAIAAAAVDLYNRGVRGNSKLNGWWSTFTEDE